MKDFYKGMKVRVSNNLDKTNNRFLAIPEMHQLKGKIIKVVEVKNPKKRIRAGKEEGCIFSWHPNDLIPIEDKPDCVEFSPSESKVTTFNPDHLVLK